jgi:hypothetical protein
VGCDEAAKGHRLDQPRFAHEGLIEQVAHDLQQNSRLFRVQVGLIGPRIAVATEQHGAQGCKGVIVKIRQGANLLKRIEQLQLAALAQLAEQ